MPIKGVAATDNELRAIEEWAAEHGEVREAWLFGSRVKVTSRPDSDFDVGVVLELPDATGTDWALGNYSSLGRAWRRALQERLGRYVSLEVVDSGHHLEGAAESRSVLVWWRKPPSSAPKPPPPRWTEDGLTAFFENARENQFATYVHKPLSRRIIAIDALLTRSYEGAINPRPWFAMMFFGRAHGAFRASSSLMMAGQIVEGMAVLRICLEAAAYGVFVSRNEERAEIWLRRSESEEARKRARALFQFAKVLEHVRSADPALSSILAELYDYSIDSGAHPNVDGFLASLDIRQIDDGREHNFIHLHADGDALNKGLRLCAQAGTFVLFAFVNVYPQRASLLGIDDEAKALAQGL